MIDIKPFQEYKKQLSEKRVVILSQTVENGFKVIKPADSSRYFENGRKRIKAKIFKRLGSWAQCPGVLCTLTFDPKKISKEEAWAYYGKLRRQFLKKLNDKRYRKMAYHCNLDNFKRYQQINVVEVQPGTGYPHIHLVFPYLRYLGENGYLTKIWGWGRVDARFKGNFSPTSYMLKYITKMDHWQDEHFNYCWLFGTRLYSLSRDYSLPQYSDKKVPEWKFYALHDCRSLAMWWFSSKHLLQRIREGPLPYDHTAIARALAREVGGYFPGDIHN